MAVLDYSVSVSVAPTAEPVTRYDAKKTLNIADAVTDHDAEIDDLIIRARNIVEYDADRAIVTQTLLQKMDAFPESDFLEIYRGPVASVTSVQYVDLDGNTQTFTDYTADTSRFPGGVFLNYSASWPSTRYIKNAVTVTYVAGDALASVSKIAKQAILLQVAHAFEQRELINYGDKTSGQNYCALINRLRGGRYP